MRKDYHIHPTVLTNPENFELFVRRALEKNIEELCITDHMPLSVSGAMDRIPAGCVRAYCRRIDELKKKYEGTIRIRCGIEIDYHPSVTDEIAWVFDAADGAFDYVLGSSHMHLFTKDFSKLSFNDFARYALENTAKAAESGLFDALSHFDMYRFAFQNRKRFPLVDDGYSPLQHEPEIREILRIVAEKGMYLEINPHLAEEKNDFSLVYPELPIVEWAMEKGLRFSYGSDAHKPASVGAYLDELEAHPVYGKALAVWEGVQ